MVRRVFVVGDAVRSRRAASVPADDIRSPLVDASSVSKAYLISSHAVQDADAMTAASRRHDRDFLHGISNKLAAANASRPYVQEAPPVYIGSVYPVRSYPATRSAEVIGDYRRRTWVAPPVSDYEVHAYLAGGPSRPYVRHTRGISVPPTSSSYPSVPKWHPSTLSYKRGSSVPRASPTSHAYNREALAQHDDVVVGVAHTSLYGDIVIGIPYNKRHMFNLEDNGTNYKTYSPFVRKSVAGSNHPYVGSTSVKPNYRRASVAFPYRNIYEEYDDIVSSAPRYRTSGTAKRYDFEDEELPTYKPKYSAAVYRGRAASLSTKLEGIPEFQVYTPSNKPSVTSTVTPYRAPSVPPLTSTYANSSSSTGCAAKPPTTRKKLPVSEARRKVRDLLCKTKNDPHYFDD